MVDYSAARTVIDASREELIEIFRWVQARGESNETRLRFLSEAGQYIVIIRGTARSISISSPIAEHATIS
jgi:hypothetical protein